MKALFEVTTPHGQAWYDLFYFLAIVVAGVLFMLHGRRRGYPLAAWSLIFISGMVLFIIGTKVVMFGAEDWRLLFAEGKLPYAASRSVLGGILLGTLGIELARRLTRFPYPVLDAYAIGLPLAMAVQRIGCFAAGCCYGTPTEVPCAVTYSVHAPAYHDHLAYGWLDPEAIVSAPVHPTQLYQVILCLLIAALVWRLRGAFQRAGNLFWFSISLYLAARFIVEFWNSPETAFLDTPGLFGLKYLQWLLLAAILLVALVIRKRAYAGAGPVAKEEKPIRPVWFFTLLSLLVLTISNRLTPVEFFVLQALMIPALFLQFREVWREKTTGSGSRVVAAYTLMLVLIFSLTITGQQSYKQLTSQESSRNTFYDISASYGIQPQSHYHEAPHYSSGCNGGGSYVPTGPEYRLKSEAFGLAFRRIQTEGIYQKLELTGQISAGAETDLDLPNTPTQGLFDIGFSVKADYRWAGMSAGVHAGSGMNDERKEEIVYTTHHGTRVYGNLSGSLRFFPYDIFYIGIRYNEWLPFQALVRSDELLQVFAGSGLGQKDGTCIEAGLMSEGEAWYVGGVGMIRNTYGIKAFLISGITREETGEKHGYLYPQVGFTYRMSK
jgi:phosphatidylglycerol:prolipoprotein diacylglycerol transferase